MQIINRIIRRRRSREAGYSLAEMLISMGIMTVVMGATAAALTTRRRKCATRAVLMTGVNNSLRTGMDLMIRDMLQIGSGLPPGHVILIPSGTGAVQMNIPGPPGTAFVTPVGDLDWAAVIPGNGLGPTINGVATDTITMLMADNNFVDMPLTGLTNTTSTIAATQPGDRSRPSTFRPASNRLLAGQLLMLEKGSHDDAGADHDDQLHEPAGDVRQRRFAEAEPDGGGGRQRRRPPRGGAARYACGNGTIPTTATRVRMISYYLDNYGVRTIRGWSAGSTTAIRPRSTTSYGTAVAIDIENLQFTYDLVDGVNNPSNVSVRHRRLHGERRVQPECRARRRRFARSTSCSWARSANPLPGKTSVFRNMLTSQVSLRGMAFVDEYLAP